MTNNVLLWLANSRFECKKIRTGFFQMPNGTVDYQNNARFIAVLGPAFNLNVIFDVKAKHC